MLQIAQPTVSNGEFTLQFILAVCLVYGIQLASSVTKNILVPLVWKGAKLNGKTNGAGGINEDLVTVIKVLVDEIHVTGLAMKETGLAIKETAQSIKVIVALQNEHEQVVKTQNESMNKKLDAIKERVTAPHG